MERIRSFVSIDIDDPALVSKVVDVQRELSGLGATIKFVEPENIHLTLKFLGEIPRFLVEEVKRALDRVSFEPFTMRIEGIGAFPSVSRPRVIWLGVTEGAERVAAIHEAVERELARLGFRRDREAFVPHVTIGRVRGGSYDRLRARLADLRGVVIGDFRVEVIRLKRSTLTSKGPIYTTLYERHAEGGAGGGTQQG